MAKILVSSCLLGFNVRYNGSCINTENNSFKILAEQHEIIPFCPEVSAGLPIPRPPAEITGGEGEDVLSGTAEVLNNIGEDVTEAFLNGARLALDKCLSENIFLAVLAERSPSCGSSLIYDGSFRGMTKAGRGVTAALLEKSGIKVFSQDNIFLLIKDFSS